MSSESLKPGDYKRFKLHRTKLRSGGSSALPAMRWQGLAVEVRGVGRISFVTDENSVVGKMHRCRLDSSMKSVKELVRFT
jgi:hypothetical protein